MIHYHGTPITPKSVLEELAGRHFCVSFAAPSQVRQCHQTGQSVMLDNGAFSFWKKGARWVNWKDYYEWCEPWLEYHTTWAIIPDVIDGSVKENDALLKQWPHGPHRGAPVWHLHEPLSRLGRLMEFYPRVCFGSSGQYASVGTGLWHHRMTEAFNYVCPNGGSPPRWLHMLRGMSLSGQHYPFASVDSTDVARNHWRTGQTRSAGEIAARWDAMQTPAVWKPIPITGDLVGAA